MTWALYRRVPRIGQGAQGTHQLITHGARAMAVQFDFSVRGQRYRVSRQAPGNLGSRLEQQRVDGSWEPLADRAQDIDDRIAVLLGLDFVTFTKTVLLPQGAFDAFLRGEARSRRDILTSLLGLERYEAAGSMARNRWRARGPRRRRCAWRSIASTQPRPRRSRASNARTRRWPRGSRRSRRARACSKRWSRRRARAPRPEPSAARAEIASAGAARDADRAGRPG